MGANAQRLIADLDQLRAAMPNAMPEDLRTDVLNMLTRIDRLVDKSRARRSRPAGSMTLTTSCDG